MSCLPNRAEEVVWQTPSLTPNFLLKYQLQIIPTFFIFLYYIYNFLLLLKKKPLLKKNSLFHTKNSKNSLYFNHFTSKTSYYY
jgi:hypothetical protein